MVFCIAFFKLSCSPRCKNWQSCSSICSWWTFSKASFRCAAVCFSDGIGYARSYLRGYFEWLLYKITRYRFSFYATISFPHGQNLQGWSTFLSHSFSLVKLKRGTRVLRHLWNSSSLYFISTINELSMHLVHRRGREYLQALAWDFITTASESGSESSDSINVYTICSHVSPSRHIPTKSIIYFIDIPVLSERLKLCSMKCQIPSNATFLRLYLKNNIG